MNQIFNKIVSKDQWLKYCLNILNGSLSLKNVLPTWIVYNRAFEAFVDYQGNGCTDWWWCILMTSVVTI